MFKRIAATVGAVVIVAVLMAGAAHAADRSQKAIILVASRSLDETPLAQAVVVAVPMPDGGHVGFIVNRPTKVRLEALFPDEPPARDVKEYVYLGGPSMRTGIFALMRNAPDDAGMAIPLIPGVVAVLDKATIDHVIETTPNAARYFVGMMLWDDDELEQELDEGLWEVRPADADSILPATTPGLWNSLRSPMAHNRGLSLG